MSGQNRSDILPGTLVDIVLKKDQSTGMLTRGHADRENANRVLSLYKKLGMVETRHAVVAFFVLY